MRGSGWLLVVAIMSLGALSAGALTISGYDPRYIQIDGNVVDEGSGCVPAGTPCTDWLIKQQEGSLGGITDGIGNSDNDILSPGSTLSGGSTLPKEDITHVYVTNNSQYLYVGEERRANNGSSAWHLFMTKLAPTYTQGQDVVFHFTNGDIEIQVCFPKGGGGGKAIAVRQVTGVSGTADVPADEIWNTNIFTSNASAVAAFEVNTAVTTALAEAVESHGTATSTYDQACFAEAAISLAALGIDPCGAEAYTTVITRSSCSLTSSCKDISAPIMYHFGGPKLTAITSSVDCSSKGCFSVSASEGILPYRFQWYDGTTLIRDITINAPMPVVDSVCATLSAGAHNVSVKVTDAVGCSYSVETGPIAVTNPLSLGIPIYSVDCANKASFSVSGSGGKTPFRIRWYDGMALLRDITVTAASPGTDSFSQTLAPGNHQIKVVLSDSAGCSVEKSIAPFTVYPILAIEPITRTVSCANEACFSAKATGGKAPFRFQWYDGTTLIRDQTVTAAAPGTDSFCQTLTPGSHEFRVELTDAQGCVVKQTTGAFTVYPILALDPITSSVDCTNKACFSVKGAGGQPTFRFQWYDGTTLIRDQTITGAEPGTDSFCQTFTPGTHQVKVVLSDARGCSTEKSATPFTVYPVLTPGAITSSVDCTNNACFSITVAGGKSPFRFQWYDGTTLIRDANSGATPETDAFCKALAPGSHTIKVVVTDANGCTAEKSASALTVYQLIGVTLAGTATCPGVVTWTASPTGGDGSYTYKWKVDGKDVAGTTKTCQYGPVGDCTAHQVCVTVTDGKGCQASACKQITQSMDTAIQ